jgi:hypothetical protein
MTDVTLAATEPFQLPHNLGKKPSSLQTSADSQTLDSAKYGSGEVKKPGVNVPLHSNNIFWLATA